jgi:hypothetical protein
MDAIKQHHQRAPKRASVTHFLPFSVALTHGRHTYSGSGSALATAIIDQGMGIGHAWIRLKDNVAGTDEYHGHTGEEGADSTAPVGGKTYKQGLLNLQKSAPPATLLADSFADAKNPALYLQHVFNDGRDHGANPGHTPNFEGTFCVTKEQFEHAKQFVTAYDFRHYGGFYHGCGFFAAGLVDAAGLGSYSTSARFTTTLPDSVPYTILWGLITLTHVNIATPGTPNYNNARTISYVYPDALADKVGSVSPAVRVFYKAP